VEFYVYIDNDANTIPDGTRFNIFNISVSNDNTAVMMAKLEYVRNSTERLLVMVGADGSTQTPVIDDTWHKIEIHYDITPADCTVTINDGTPFGFTRNTYGAVTQIFLGCNDSIDADDVCNFTFGAVSMGITTP